MYHPKQPRPGIINLHIKIYILFNNAFKAEIIYFQHSAYNRLATKLKDG